MIKTVKGDITKVTDVQAIDNGIRSIAFPSISTGAYGFPVELAAKIAVHTVNRFLQESHDQRVLIKSYRQSMATAGCFS